MAEAQGETVLAPAGIDTDDTAALWRHAEALAAEAEGTTPAAAEDAAEGEEKPAPTKKTKAAPAPSRAAADGTDPELEQLRELARKKGFVVDGNRVEVSERIRLREERQRHREAIAKREAELSTRDQELGTRAEKLKAFEEAHSKRDLDGLARAAGFENWRAIVDEQAKMMASPEYREIQAPKKAQAERDERDKRFAEEQTQRQQYEAKEREIAAYKLSMADEMTKAGDVLEAMAGDPDIVQILYAARAEHYTTTGDELSLEDLIETPARVTGGKAPLDLLRAKWESLDRIFGNRTAEVSEASEAASRSGVNSAKPAKKPPKTVSQKNATEVAAPAKFASEEEYMRHFTRLLEQSSHTSE